MTDTGPAPSQIALSTKAEIAARPGRHPDAWGLLLPPQLLRHCLAYLFDRKTWATCFAVCQGWSTIGPSDADWRRLFLAEFDSGDLTLPAVAKHAQFRDRCRARFEVEFAKRRGKLVRTEIVTPSFERADFCSAAQLFHLWVPQSGAHKILRAPRCEAVRPRSIVPPTGLSAMLYALPAAAAAATAAADGKAGGGSGSQAASAGSEGKSASEAEGKSASSSISSETAAFRAHGFVRDSGAGPLELWRHVPTPPRSGGSSGGSSADSGEAGDQPKDVIERRELPTEIDWTAIAASEDVLLDVDAGADLVATVCGQTLGLWRLSTCEPVKAPVVQGPVRRVFARHGLMLTRTAELMESEWTVCDLRTGAARCRVGDVHQAVLCFSQAELSRVPCLLQLRDDLTLALFDCAAGRALRVWRVRELCQVVSQDEVVATCTDRWVAVQFVARDLVRRWPRVFLLDARSDCVRELPLPKTGPVQGLFLDRDCVYVAAQHPSPPPYNTLQSVVVRFAFEPAEPVSDRDRDVAKSKPTSG